MVFLSRKHNLFFLLVLSIYLGLLLPAINRQGVSWDEQVDLFIARSYLGQPDNWLKGSPLDLSQTRLPHASVALMYILTGASDLITARLVSVLIGSLTLIGVFFYCKKNFDPVVALLAVSFFAASPFYLSFARVAFTETDIFLACILVFLLIALDQVRQQPTLGRTAIVGLLLGLALSAKFTALSIIPVVIYIIFLGKRNMALPKLPPANGWRVGAVTVAFCSLVFIGLGLANTILSGTHVAQFRLPVFLPLMVGWILGLTWLIRHRNQTSSTVLLSVLAVSLALLTFLLVPPEHLTNPNILRALLDRFRGEIRFSPAFMLEASGLHIFSILFKSSPLIGLWLLVSWLLILFQWHRPELRAPILISLFYFCGLALLPLAQTFYMIPILPILAIFAADRFYRLAAHWHLAAIGLGIGFAVLLVIDLMACYPDFNLNGYQWLGARYIFGRPSIGYRSIIQTPSDGVEQVISWLNEHATAGDQVTSYILEGHIVKAVSPNPAYQMINGFRYTQQPSTIYVVTEINTEIPQSWWTTKMSRTVFRSPYDAAWLAGHYTKVFSVPRRFGIEMAAVWKKK